MKYAAIFSCIVGGQSLAFSQESEEKTLFQTLCNNPEKITESQANIELNGKREGIWFFQPIKHLLEEDSLTVYEKLREQVLRPHTICGVYREGKRHGQWVQIGESFRPAVVETYLEGKRHHSILLYNREGEKCYAIRIVRERCVLMHDLQDKERAPFVVSRPEYEYFLNDWLNNH